MAVAISVAQAATAVEDVTSLFVGDQCLADERKAAAVRALSHDICAIAVSKDAQFNQIFRGAPAVCCVPRAARAAQTTELWFAQNCKRASARSRSRRP